MKKNNRNRIFYFIAIIFLHICKKVAKALIRRANNYNLTCFRSGQNIAVVSKFFILFFNFIEIWLKIKNVCLQDCQAGESAVKCLFQGHNKMAQVGFEPWSYRSQSQSSNHSTMLYDQSTRNATAFQHDSVFQLIFIYPFQLVKEEKLIFGTLAITRCTSKMAS